MSAVVDYAQAGELKFGQVGIANLRVRTLDVAQLAAEMQDRVQRAPNPVSYTHLDVYKRQVLEGSHLVAHGVIVNVINQSLAVRA